MSFPRYERYKDSGVDWLGEVPEHWDVLPLKRAFTIVGGSTPSSEVETYWGDGVVWVTPADLSGLTDRYISQSERTITKEGLKSCSSSVVPAGSIVLSTRAPIGSLAIAGVELCTNQGCKSLVPTPGIVPSCYAFLLSIVTEELQVRGKGTTFLEISADVLGSVEIPRPPSEEQRNIATFLEVETTKIDALIEEQRRLIELLKEKRQAVISHAVTKGLNPDAPMKDSEVEWMASIPAHWRVLSLSRITEAACDGPFGSGLKSDHYVDAGIRVIRLQNIRDGVFDGTDAAFIDPVHYADLGDHDVIGRDLLIAGLGDERNAVGRACVAPSEIEPAMVKADCFRFRLTPDALPEFVAAQLSIGAPTDAGRLATGSTRSRIPVSKMSSRPVAIPSVEEQSAIVSYLGRRDAEFAGLRSQAELGINLLQERRSALISAAVTGKIDVRKYIPKEAA